MDDLEKPERPPPDASLTEIWQWMEEDWGWALATAMDDEDEDDVVKVEIINHQQEEVVGAIDTDGNLDTESEALRNV